MRGLTSIYIVAVMAGCASPQVSGVKLENFDRSVRPQDDLYEFVNGTWLKDTMIPADKSNYGVFSVLADKARLDVRAIIEEAAKSGGEPGSEARKVAALYKSVMDTAEVDRRGAEPMARAVASIGELRDHEGVMAWIAKARRDGLPVPLVLYVSPDAKAPERYAVHLTQGGLGLPDRDYYLKSDDRYSTIRQKYLSHIASMWTAVGWAKTDLEALEIARAIVAHETALARGMWDRVKRRDRSLTYNKVDREALSALVPDVNWREFLEASGVGGAGAVVVREKTYLPVLGELLKTADTTTWRRYFLWSLLRSRASVLSQALDQRNFEFFGQVLQGVPQQQPRWERAVALVNGTLGEAVGKLYVARHFKPEAKRRMARLVENLRAAYGDALKKLTWLGDKTRVQALDKLARFRPKIGYPDKWRDYSSLTLRADDLYGNVERAARWRYDLRAARLDQPVDKDEWFMTPQTVNAYYNPRGNEIVFPAAILQPPFFDLEADDAVNYGAIGAVIGHEMGHGFDDQGSKFDGKGVLRNWWTAQDLAEFKRRTSRLVAQYSAFVAIGEDRVNGKFTLGENIGDLGGLSIAYRAYRMSLSGQEAPVMDGFTGDQRFFIGWAQVWPRLYRDEELRRRLVVDSHSPSRFRTNGPVRNMPEFLRAFEVKDGDKMWLPAAERVKIW